MSQITLRNEVGSKALTGEILCKLHFSTVAELLGGEVASLSEPVSVTHEVSTNDYRLESGVRGLLHVAHTEDSTEDGEPRFRVVVELIDEPYNFYFGSRWTVSDLTEIVSDLDLSRLVFTLS